MSKKKFKAGLESLFSDTGADDQLPGIRPLLVEEEARESLDTRRTRPKKRSSKNFTSDLEGLFHNALDKEYKEPVRKSSLASRRDTKIKKRSDRPVIGIDALIRRTSTENREEIKSSSPLKKRITFSLEKKKIEKLKDIAKSKKAYLKDIVDDIISQYLEECADHPNNAN
ncbi:MAG: hypothetical protein AB8G86_11350 [Saprospiraceae bacterium]